MKKQAIAFLSLCTFAINALSTVPTFDQNVYLYCSESALAAMMVINSQDESADDALKFVHSNYPAREKNILALSKIGLEYRGGDLHLNFQEIQQFLAGVCYASSQVTAMD